MSQHRGSSVSFPVRTQVEGAPSAPTHGLALADFALPPPPPPKWAARHVVEIIVAGSGTTKVRLYGYTASGGWGSPPGALLAEDAAFAVGTHWIVLENLAAFDRIALALHSAAGGPPTVTASIAPLVELTQLG